MIEIITILDRSGSMSNCATDAIGGMNTFLEKQKRALPDSLYTQVQFDDQYQIDHNGVSIQWVPLLTKETYVPRGLTALYDAVGRTIDDVGKRLDRTPQNQRPSKVIVAILTDGLENASQSWQTGYTTYKIQEMIKHQREVYSWEFIFLAANQDAIATGGNMGIPTPHSVNINTSRAGMAAFGNTVSDAVAQYAACGSLDSMNLQTTYTSHEQEAEKEAFKED